MKKVHGKIGGNTNKEKVEDKFYSLNEEKTEGKRNMKIKSGVQQLE